MSIVDQCVRADAEHGRIVGQLTRRGLLGGVAGASVLGLAGCGVLRQQSPAPHGDRAIDTALGEKRVPSSPKRIVSLDYFPGLTMVDVGLTPVGVIDYVGTGDLPDRYAVLTGEQVQVIGQNGQPDLETVKSLSPDLIVSQNYRTSIEKQRNLYRQLEGSGPTVVFAVEWQSDWPTVSLSIADAVGRTERMRALKARVDERVEGLKATYGEVIRNTRWAQVGAGEAGRWVLYPAHSSFAALARMLGIQFIDAVGEVRSRGGDAHSYETLDRLNSADVLLHPVKFDGSTTPALSALLQQNQWTSLRAVRAGHAVGAKHLQVSSFGWALDALDEIEVAMLRPLLR